MPRHYHEATAEIAVPTISGVAVNCDTLTVATITDCDELTATTVNATTVSGSNTQMGGDIFTHNGDVVVAASGQGLVLVDSDGVQWRVQVDTAGVLTTTAL
jgi:hypothetical protein